MPVATRRQSGRLPPPTHDKAEQSSDEEVLSNIENDFEDSLSELTESDDGSDWGNSRKGRGPSKRPKLSDKSPVPKKRVHARLHPSLSLLPTMPLDILFEIFGNISPQDLISLTRTNKPLRQTLMSRQAITIWKAVRENVGGPPPSPDFSEPQWAVLIFGGSICQSCEAKGVIKIDFALRRRVCTVCKKNNLVVTSKFPTKFPNFDKVILDLIPYTNVGGWAHGHASTSKFYWEEDIYDMARRWGAMQNDVHMRIPGAKQKLETFRDDRKNLVLSIREHALTCSKWHADVREEHLKLTYEVSDRRRLAIYARFKELGYIEADINAIRGNQDIVTRSAELTERAWKHARTVLEPQIEKSRNRRISAGRGVILKQVYESYLKTLAASQWTYQPSVFEIRNFSCFAPIMNAAHDVTVNAGSFDEAMLELPHLIHVWLEERKAGLKEKLVLAKASATPEPGSNASAASTESTDTSNAVSTITTSTLSALDTTNPASTGVDLIDLATSVFVCGRLDCMNNTLPWGYDCRNPFFGWNMAGGHQCHVVRYDEYVYERQVLAGLLEISKEGSAAAAELVKLSGLDAVHGTISEMDRKGVLFFCSQCVSARRPVYTWRSAVAHSMAKRHSDPTWEILSAIQVSTISPEIDPIHDSPAWACNHCAIHFQNYQPRFIVLKHLQDAHNIGDPKEHRDLICFPEKRRAAIRLPTCGGNQPAHKNVKCKHCSTHSSRLFDLMGVQSHIKAKHKICSPTEDRDWMLV